LQEDGLDLRGQAAVHQSHLELVFVVGDGADAAQHCLGSLLARELHHQPVEGGDRDVGQRTGDLSEHLDALLHGEQRILARIVEDGDGEVAKELGTARDEINVAVGRRVEGAGI
jgi:hypothetical protein